jgi:hypothetical protein
LTPNAHGRLSFNETFALLRTLRVNQGLDPSTFLFLLTHTPNESNWFAAEDPVCVRNGFGLVEDYSWVTAAPVSVVVAHYVLEGIFNALVTEGGIPWRKLWHAESRGCLFDFCQRKSELALKLRTADICGDCTAAFQGICIPDDLLRQAVAIMEASRRLAVNTKQWLTADPPFQEWPFPVAITRHKVVQARNPLHRFMLLLDHFDSLVRYFYLAHEVTQGRKPELAERPSLGWWVDRLASVLPRHDPFRSVVQIANRENVVALRNEMRAHGWISASEDAYDDEAQQLEQTLTEIEAELRPFLDTWRLVVPRTFRLREGAWDVQGDLLMGSHTLHPRFSVRLTEPNAAGMSDQGKVFVADRGMQRFMPISPFIESTRCPICQNPRILISDGTTDGRFQYIDVLMGHRVKLSAA